MECLKLGSFAVRYVIYLFISCSFAEMAVELGY